MDRRTSDTYSLDRERAHYLSSAGLMSPSPGQPSLFSPVSADNLGSYSGSHGQGELSGSAASAMSSLAQLQGRYLPTQLGVHGQGYSQLMSQYLTQCGAGNVTGGGGIGGPGSTSDLPEHIKALFPPLSYWPNPTAHPDGYSSHLYGMAPPTLYPPYLPLNVGGSGRVGGSREVPGGGDNPLISPVPSGPPTAMVSRAGSLSQLSHRTRDAATFGGLDVMSVNLSNPSLLSPGSCSSTEPIAAASGSASASAHTETMPENLSITPRRPSTHAGSKDPRSSSQPQVPPQGKSKTSIETTSSLRSSSTSSGGTTKDNQSREDHLNNKKHALSSSGGTSSEKCVLNSPSSRTSRASKSVNKSSPPSAKGKGCISSPECKSEQTDKNVTKASSQGDSAGYKDRCKDPCPTSPSPRKNNNKSSKNKTTRDGSVDIKSNHIPDCRHPIQSNSASESCNKQPIQSKKTKSNDNSCRQNDMDDRRKDSKVELCQRGGDNVIVGNNKSNKHDDVSVTVKPDTSPLVSDSIEVKFEKDYKLTESNSSYSTEVSQCIPKRENGDEKGQTIKAAGENSIKGEPKTPSPIKDVSSSPPEARYTRKTRDSKCLSATSDSALSHTALHCNGNPVKNEKGNETQGTAVSTVTVATANVSGGIHYSISCNQKEGTVHQNGSRKVHATTFTPEIGTLPSVTCLTETRPSVSVADNNNNSNSSSCSDSSSQSSNESASEKLEDTEPHGINRPSSPDRDFSGLLGPLPSNIKVSPGSQKSKSSPSKWSPNNKDNTDKKESAWLRKSAGGDNSRKRQTLTTVISPKVEDSVSVKAEETLPLTSTSHIPPPPSTRERGGNTIRSSFTSSCRGSPSPQQSVDKKPINLQDVSGSPLHRRERYTSTESISSRPDRPDRPPVSSSSSREQLEIKAERDQASMPVSMPGYPDAAVALGYPWQAAAPPPMDYSGLLHSAPHLYPHYVSPQYPLALDPRLLQMYSDKHRQAWMEQAGYVFPPMSQYPQAPPMGHPHLLGMGHHPYSPSLAAASSNIQPTDLTRRRQRTDSSDIDVDDSGARSRSSSRDPSRERTGYNAQQSPQRPSHPGRSARNSTDRTDKSLKRSFDGIIKTESPVKLHDRHLTSPSNKFYTKEETTDTPKIKTSPKEYNHTIVHDPALLNKPMAKTKPPADDAITSQCLPAPKVESQSPKVKTSESPNEKQHEASSSSMAPTSTGNIPVGIAYARQRTANLSEPRDSPLNQAQRDLEEGQRPSHHAHRATSLRNRGQDHIVPDLSTRRTHETQSSQIIPSDNDTGWPRDGTSAMHRISSLTREERDDDQAQMLWPPERPRPAGFHSSLQPIPIPPGYKLVQDRTTGQMFLMPDPSLLKALPESPSSKSNQVSTENEAADSVGVVPIQNDDKSVTDTHRQVPSPKMINITAINQDNRVYSAAWMISDTMTKNKLDSSSKDVTDHSEAGSSPRDPSSVVNSTSKQKPILRAAAVLTRQQHAVRPHTCSSQARSTTDMGNSDAGHSVHNENAGNSQQTMSSNGTSLSCGAVHPQSSGPDSHANFLNEADRFITVTAGLTLGTTTHTKTPLTMDIPVQSRNQGLIMPVCNTNAADSVAQQTVDKQSRGCSPVGFSDDVPLKYLIPRKTVSISTCTDKHEQISACVQTTEEVDMVVEPKPTVSLIDTSVQTTEFTWPKHSTENTPNSDSMSYFERRASDLLRAASSIETPDLIAKLDTEVCILDDTHRNTPPVLTKMVDLTTANLTGQGALPTFSQHVDYNIDTDMHSWQAADGLHLLSLLAEQVQKKQNNLKDETMPERSVSPDINKNYNAPKSFYFENEDFATSTAKFWKSEEGEEIFHPQWTSPIFKVTSEPDSMDAMELDFRVRLADIQRKYKEKQRELARLHPKKGDDRHYLKRKVGRPKKRRSRKNSTCKSDASGHSVVSDTEVSAEPTSKKKKLNTEVNESLVEKPQSSKASEQSTLPDKSEVKSSDSRCSSKSSDSGKRHECPKVKEVKQIKKKEEEFVEREELSTDRHSDRSDMGGSEVTADRSDMEVTGDRSDIASSEADSSDQDSDNSSDSQADDQQSDSSADDDNSNHTDELGGQYTFGQNASMTTDVTMTSNSTTKSKRKKSLFQGSSLDDQEEDTPAKKRKPGRPKKFDEESVTETIVAKKPKNFSFFSYGNSKGYGSAFKKSSTSSTFKKSSNKTNFSNRAGLVSKGKHVNRTSLYSPEWYRRRSERISISESLQTAKTTTVTDSIHDLHNNPMLTSQSPSNQNSQVSPSQLPSNTTSLKQPTNQDVFGSSERLLLAASTSKMMSLALKSKNKDRGKAQAFQDLSQKVKKKYTAKTNSASSVTSVRANITPTELSESAEPPAPSSKPPTLSVSSMADSDSDTDSSSDGDDVPLSALKERPTTPEPRHCKLTSDDLQDDLQVLFFKEGLFYEARVKAIQPPDIYGVVIEGERGNRPHILPQQDLLDQAVADVRPPSARCLVEGMRVCAYWSQQFSCLYPGKISRDDNLSSSPVGSQVQLHTVEFDDGDSGKIPLEHIRMLPQDFPLQDLETNPLMMVGSRKKRTMSDDLVFFMDSKERKTSTETSDKTKTTTTDDKPRKKALSMPNKMVSKDNKERDSASKSLLKTPVKSKFASTKHEGAGKQTQGKPEHAGKILERSFSTPAKTIDRGNIKTQALDQGQTRTKERAQSTSTSKVKPNSNNGRMNAYDDSDQSESSNDDSIATSSQSGDSDSYTDTEDEEYVPGQQKPQQIKSKRPSDKEGVSPPKAATPPTREQSPTESVSSGMVPQQQLLWQWVGKGTKRPGMKGRAKREYYKAIQRGSEIIHVGESAVFLSAGRTFPYIGRIVSLWQGWGGNMVVKVKWYYHPEETKGGKKLAEIRGALYESPHVDENDVQTISHKCHLMSYLDWKVYRARKRRQCQIKGVPCDFDDDIYYLAGTYDPTIGMITFQPDVKLL